MSSDVTASAVKVRARELGFDLCGISPAADLPELKFLRDWLDRGFGGTMTYLHRSARKRADVRHVVPSARSVIVTGTLYNSDRPYSTEIADIDLRVSPQSGEWEIAGQILGPSQSGGKVNLESDSFSASADLNELAEFGFQSVPSGIYTMFVHLPELEIEIPPLQLGH